MEAQVSAEVMKTLIPTRARVEFELPAPDDMVRAVDLTPEEAASVADSRDTIRDILNGSDDRLLVVVGPCSIHDQTAAEAYADWLADMQTSYARDLLLAMRVYVEKPRTLAGWTGLANDPMLDGSGRADVGIRMAREIMRSAIQRRIPVATEFTSVTMPLYLADLVSWTAIGARTVESQVHRQMASGLPCPVGFKNGTSGDVMVAIRAVAAASQPHRYIAMSGSGTPAMMATTGNPDTHIILRGGAQPNYDTVSVTAASTQLTQFDQQPRLLIDCSHGNSGRVAARQVEVATSVAAQIAAGASVIRGVMVEGQLVAGRQPLLPGRQLIFGQSITDECLGLEDTSLVLQRLADASRQRRT